MEQRLALIFNAQQTHKYTLRQTNAAERIAKLRRLREAIERHESKIFEALQSDLRKSTFEAAVTELYFIYGELDFAIRNLSVWMRPKRVGRTMSSPFAKNRIYMEPKGQCLIISPWNYPFQLAMSPLISAIAAGNCVIVKPSEISVETSNLLNKIINDTFEEHEVACILGGAEVSSLLLKFPFDHIFFTGSTAVGKIVMEAAAKNLSSVTLELGGKSPVIIDESADLQKAAAKIAWGKAVNSGQTCIAPDYVFVPHRQVEAFVSCYAKAMEKMYGNLNHMDRKSYCKIVNQRHFERLRSWVDEAVEKGAHLLVKGEVDENNAILAPMVLGAVPLDAKLMQEEIFGPILPIVAYGQLQEAIDHINAGAKPLALYLFSTSKKNIRQTLKNTSSGGTCINDVLVHISNPKLPFGGVNTSGMGSSHGVFGFRNFSHERSVVFQSRLDLNKLVYPPYELKKWVLKLLKRIM